MCDDAKLVVGMLIPAYVTRDRFQSELTDTLKLKYSSISPFYASETPGLSLCYVTFQNKLQLQSFCTMYPLASSRNGLIYVFYESPCNLYNMK